MLVGLTVQLLPQIFPKSSKSCLSRTKYLAASIECYRGKPNNSSVPLPNSKNRPKRSINDQCHATTTSTDTSQQWTQLMINYSQLTLINYRECLPTALLLSLQTNVGARIRKGRHTLRRITRWAHIAAWSSPPTHSYNKSNAQQNTNLSKASSKNSRTPKHRIICIRSICSKSRKLQISRRITMAGPQGCLTNNIRTHPDKKSYNNQR